ncbi:MAG TPA: hypothetical protein VHA12_00645 [Candidatus Nanoarchaeia archaeon]|nr:hypothetical protein [Candidatus Nanoarchaeia archaeon]
MSNMQNVLNKKDLKNFKEIRFYFCDKDGDAIVEGYATHVNIKNLKFINNYVGGYWAFTDGGFSMLKNDLEREFRQIGAILGFVEDRLGIMKYGSELDNITLEGFKYKIVKYKKSN